MTVLRKMAVRASRHRASERGFTLIELLLAMVIFVTVMSVMASAVAAMTKNMRQATGVSIATDQARFVFTRLDKQVRYANAITAPGVGAAGTGWYVELSLEDPKKYPGSGNKNGLCEQWRVVGDRMENRSWRVNSGGNSTQVAPWTSVATGLTYQRAFGLTPVGSYVHQGLTVDLQITSSKAPPGTAETKATFFGRNTDDVPPSTSKCQQEPRQ